MIYFQTMATLAIIITLILYGLWLLIPFLYGLPWVPTEKRRIRKALEMADIRPDDVVYDLGAGDGRVLLTAIKDFGAARGVGIEISPAHLLLADLRARSNGSRRRVTLRREDFFKAEMRDADVVFLYLTPNQLSRIQAHLAAQLQPGARVVSISFDFPDWQPTGFDDEHLIFAYKMPPLAGGLAAFLAHKIT
ncbi:MAG: class I SAM-dependent methyltransferase [Anaerolineales bacterium]|nr:class I SAM-dependent methyltransferase [Anaerolineales bacterium]